MTCHLLRGQLTWPTGCPLGLLIPWSWEVERGVRVVNKNNGHLMLAAIRETQTCVGKKEGSGMGEAVY